MPELCEYKLIISVLVIEMLSTTTISVLFHSRPISKAFFDLLFVCLFVQFSSSFKVKQMN